MASSARVVFADREFLFDQRVLFDDYQFTFTGATSANGHIRIRRVSTDEYWDGAAWVASETWVATTVNAPEEKHEYPFTPSVDLVQEYLEVAMRVNNDPMTIDQEDFFVEKPLTPGMTFG